jgi:hypothetical protein
VETERFGEARLEGDLTVLARPYRVRWVVVPVAAAFLALFSVVGALLKQSSTGVHFDASSQGSMIALGVVLAIGTLMLLRPRVRAGTSGIEIRNVFWTKTFDWSQTYGVSFPDGARWAHLELPYDEYVPIMAIQSLDGERAVTAMRELRRYHRASQEDASQED